MIQILVISHNQFANGITSAVEMIAGKPEGFHFLGLTEELGFDSYAEKLEEKMLEINNPDGIIAFIDLFGGTPGNNFCIIKQKHPEIKCKGIAGMNLGMIIECIYARESNDLDSLAKNLIDVGKDCIKDLDELM